MPPTSRLNDYQIVEAARRHYEDGVPQAELAKELEISQSYMARLIRNAKESGLIKVQMFTDVDPAILKAEEIRTAANGQTVFTTDSGCFCAVIDTAKVMPFLHRMTIGGVTVTINVERS